MQAADADRLAIRELVENWALWRDAGARFPAGYRHLGYLQAKNGFTVKAGLPGLTGEAVERLYHEGAGWLAGSPTPGEPL